MFIRNNYIFLIFFISFYSFSQKFPSLKELSTGKGSIGGLDPVWLISEYIPLTTIPTNPDSYTYKKALINANCAPNAWVNPSSLSAPVNNGNWISSQGESCTTTGIPGGYRFFRLPLNLPDLCNGITLSNNYTLYFTGYVDDNIENVYVNGIAKNIKGGSYSSASKIDFALKDSWKVGVNYIDILVKNNPPDNGSASNPYGLLLVADPVKSATTDLDQDGIPDLTDPCPCQKWSDPSTCSPSCASSGITTSTQPNNQTGCAGSYVSFIANANASKFQWKESRDNGVTFTSINNGGVYSGAQSSTLNINGITDNYNGYIYKCFFLSTSNCIDSSNTASVTITPVQTTTTNTISICKGGSTTLTATTSPLANYSYIWQVPAGVPLPGNVNTFNTSFPGTYTVNVFAPNNLICNADFEDNQVTSTANSAIAKNGDISCWTTTATDNKIEVWNNGFQGVSSYSGKQFIEINATQAASIYQDFSGIAGTQLAISFAHRGREGVDVIKVEIGPPTGPFVSLGNYSDGKAWGYYTTNFTLPTTEKYRLKFTAVSTTTLAGSGCASNPLSCGNFLDAISIKTSTCANTSKEFIVNEIPLPIAQITGANTVCKNDASPTLTFTGSNGTAPYIFTYSINGGANKTITSTGNIATLAIPTTTVGESTYKLISVKEGSSLTCSQALTSTLTYKILPISVGGTLSKDQTICAGSTPTLLTLTGNVGSVTKWQSCEVPNTTWTDITNTTASYTPSTLTKTTKFRVEVKNDICSPEYSNEITITVDEKSIGGTISSDQTICETATPATLTLSGNTGQLKKWQFSTTPFSTWLDISNSTTTYTPPKLTSNTKYRAVIQNGVCPEAYALPATISILTLEKLNVSCGLSSTTDVEFTWTDITNETSYDYTYSIAGGSSLTGRANSNATSVTIPVTADGQTVEITLTPTGATCAQPETKNCISKTCPAPRTNQLTEINVCSGGSINIPPFTSPLSDAATSYTWRVNYPGFSIGTSGTQSVPYVSISNSIPPSFTAPTTTTPIIATFSVNAANATCTGPTMNFKVIINPLPTLNITNDGPICSGVRPIQLNENSGNGISWSWTKTGSGILSSTTINNPTISNATHGDVVTVEARDANNCINTASTSLVIYALPTINAGNDQIMCSGNSITLSGSGGINYSWDQSVVNGIAFKPTITNLYTVTGIDLNKCSNTDQVQIVVNPTPSINIVNLNVCSGIPFEIAPLDIINGQIVPSATNYTWTTSTPINISGASNQPVAQNKISGTLTNGSASAETISYTVTAHNGTCTSDFNVNVNLYPLPEFTPSARSKCINEPLYVKANLASVSSLVWNGPASFTKTETNDNEILVSNLASSSHQGLYTVVAKDLNGCENTKTMNVSINQLPVIDAGTNFSICNNEAVTLKGSGGVKYTWDNSVEDGITFLLNSNKTFKVIGEDANGCKNTDQININVNPLPDFMLSVNEPCEKQDLIFKVDLTGNPSTAGILSSDWKGPNNFTSTSLTPTIPNAGLIDTGYYTFNLKDNNLCSTVKSIYATVNRIDTIHILDIPPKCINDNPFILPITNITGGTWSSKDNTSILNPTTGLFAPSKSTPDPNNKVEISYTTATIFPPRKCPSSKTKEVIINPIPDSNFYATKTILCIDDTLHLIVNNPMTHVNYTWDLGNGTMLNHDHPFNYLYTNDGDFTIKLEAKLANCKVSKTMKNYIHIIPKPSYVNFSQSATEIDFYNPDIQFTSTTNGKYVYWNFGDETFSTSNNPSHKFPEVPGNYIIELTASNMEKNHCSASVKHSIFMPEPLIYFIPNSFTPNGDEINNVFLPIFTSGYDPQNYSFYIYNRWGELIFESHNSQIGWDGTYGDHIVENDTYTWKVEFKEKLQNYNHHKTGHVNIIR